MASLRKHARHQQDAYREVHTVLKNQLLAIETFQNKWHMAGQEAYAFATKTRSQSRDFARAELTTLQRFEDSPQRQYDGQLRSHVRALQDEHRDHIGQEEDKLRKGPPASSYHLTENCYIVNSETIMDVSNYIPFSAINPQAIDVV